MNSIIPTISGLLPLAIGAVAAPQDTETTVAVWWIIGAAGAAALFNQLVSAWNNLTGRFKSEGTGPEYVTRVNCHEAHQKTEAVLKASDAQREKSIADLEEKIENTFNRLDEKLESKQNEMRTIVRADISGVHQRVDAILAAVSELKGKVESI